VPLQNAGDAEGRLVEFMMKSLSARIILACASLLAAGSPALSQDVATCFDHAEAAAAQWSNGQIEPLSDANTADPGNYVVIMYGQKFQRPYSRGGSLNVIRHYDGDLVSWRNKIYDDEYDRCMGYNASDRIYFVVSGN
jgi:hypothetical protein